MKVIQRTEESDIATVYIAENEKGNLIEFVESTQPPLSYKQKWVLVISTLYGCPIDCKFCDAGGNYKGKLTLKDLFFQVDYAIQQKFPDGIIDTERLKIQLARMGEPSFNRNVLDFLRLFPERYKFKNFTPSLSTIAPAGTDDFFNELLALKKSHYDDTFQLQFSIHSTDAEQRKSMITSETWSFEKIAKYSSLFYSPNGKKISLNFALTTESIFDTDDLLKYFSPELFLIKITPLNPTFKSMKNGLESMFSNDSNGLELIDKLKNIGYDTILSIGEYEENYIGSNCGQYVKSVCENEYNQEISYTYRLVNV